MFVKYLHLTNRLLAGIAVALILVMMFSTTADVGGRYLFNSPIHGTVDLSQTLLVFVVFLTLGYAEFMKRHIRMEMLPSKLPTRSRMLLEGLFSMAALALVGLITYGAALEAYKATVRGEYTMGLINFPTWPGRIALAVGCLALFSEYLMGAVGSFRNYLMKLTK